MSNTKHTEFKIHICTDRLTTQISLSLNSELPSLLHKVPEKPQQEIYHVEF